MKRRITLSIALALSVVLVSLMSSDRAAQAQNQTRVVADTGVMRLGPDQILRLTVSTRGGNDSNVRFRHLEYTDTGATTGVRKLAISTQDSSDLIPLTAGEATSVDFRRCDYPICIGVRGIVLSSRDVAVNAQIVNESTGEVTSQIVF